MSRDDPQMKIRLPAELKDHIEETAKTVGRSMNAEIVARLKSTMQGYVDVSLSQGHQAQELERLTKELHDLRAASAPTLGKLTTTIEELVREVMVRKGLSFEDALLLCVTKGSTMTTGVPAVVFQYQQGTPLSEVRAALRETEGLLPDDGHFFVEPSPNVSTKVLR